MQTRRVFFLTLVAAVFILVGSLRGQDAATPAGMPTAGALRIGVVDVADVFDRYGRSVELEEKINREKDAMEAEGRARRQDVQRKTEELEQLNPTSPRRRELELELNRLKADLRFFTEKSSQMLEERYDQYTSEILGDIEGQITRYGAEQGYTLIFKVESKPMRGPKALQIQLKAVLYHDSSVDLTEPVLLALNAVYEAAQKK